MAPSLFEMMYQACKTPGIHPRIQRRMFIQKSAVQPRFKKTDTGGNNIARKYKQTSPLDDTLSAILSLSL